MQPKKRLVLSVVLAVILIAGLILITYTVRQQLGSKSVKGSQTIHEDLDEEMQCNDFNQDPANTVVTYQDPTRGFTVQLPYNHEWGNSASKVSPYDEKNDTRSIEFGPVGPYREGGCARPYSLTFLPATTTEQRIKEINDQFGNFELAHKPEVININGLTVIKYAGGAMGITRVLEVIGKEYIYSVASYPVGDFEALEQIVKSIKLIPVEQASSSERILLTPGNVRKYFSKGCARDFNFDPANQSVTYQSSTRGLLVELPYNDNWGNNQYRLTPYDEYASGISHGPMGVFEGGGCARNESIRFLPAKSAEQRVKEINAIDADFLVEKPKLVQINGLTVIKYTTGGLCTDRTLEVIGKKSNYEVRHLCMGEFETLESIVKTMKLIP